MEVVEHGTADMGTQVGEGVTEAMFDADVGNTTEGTTEGTEYEGASVDDSSVRGGGDSKGVVSLERGWDDVATETGGVGDSLTAGVT